MQKLQAKHYNFSISFPLIFTRHFIIQMNMISMRKILLFLLTAALNQAAFSQDPATDLSIIPIPASVKIQTGYFLLPKTIVVEAPDQQALGVAVNDLAVHLKIAGSAIYINRQPT